ncbi:MAG: hypothetical protein HOM52_13010 [Rhodospirillaceae bacterium]|jgi:hypothetical protein|nr:hypothetical protein [Rhodospirillaceae bacterium]MBT3928082.1 hypothetical protein [Rhodospirillaceae bacterium]MBT4427493.1 hypothetical protein [Rhodospirillaceae bacterium]MBT5039425.1 hypothetical protein [Rhodospirillaceae bacterium]MBT5675298.1 hypothetical protein [Rhodospirillaceae bacterium]
MPNLDEAVAHLGRAVEQLTRALENGAGNGDAEQAGGLAESLRVVQKDRDELHGELESLRAEQRKSGAALRDAQEHYAAMQVVSEAVAGRLDGAIGELRILLNE